MTRYYKPLHDIMKYIGWKIREFIRTLQWLEKNTGGEILAKRFLDEIIHINPNECKIFLRYFHPLAFTSIKVSRDIDFNVGFR